MDKVMILGAGHVGRLLARLLHESPSYDVVLVDVHNVLPFADGVNLKTMNLDARDPDVLAQVFQDEKIQAVVSCLPYFLNIAVAKVAHASGVAYFDLTEDVATTNLVKGLAQTAKAPMMPQCGLAPGLVNIIAADLVKKLDEVETLELCVGALPDSSSHPLKYALTWSVDGLINEYCNPCPAMVGGVYRELPPLEGVKDIHLLNLQLESFHTSGGVGTLIDTYGKTIPNIAYKTLRYPGHAALMRFLLTDLNMRDDRETLKRILSGVLPENTDDCVYIYVSAKGMKQGKSAEVVFINKYHSLMLFGERIPAIAITTAASCAAVMDLLLQQGTKPNRLVTQEEFTLSDLFANQFGSYLKSEG